MSEPSSPFESPLELFESPKELINGAKERILELESIIQSIRETSNYAILSDTDPKTGEKIVKLRLKDRFPIKVSRLASSTVKELRIALDQAFCEAAVALGRPNAKGIYFPFGRSADELHQVVSRNCKDVDQRLIDFCLGFNPHYGADSDGVLWTLSRLAGLTHQSIIGVGWQDTGSFISQAVVVERGPLQLTINKWNSTHNELEIARLGSSAIIHVNPNFALRLNIIFSGRCYAVSHRPLVSTLDEFCGIAQSIILGIEAETARLKGIKL